MAAFHVVGVDLQLRLGIDFGVVRQQQVAVGLVGITVLRIGMHDHLAVEYRAGRAGQHDPEQLFYLRSRGVDDASARALLTFAFAEEVVDRVGMAALRARLEKLLLGRLPERVKELL